MTSYKTNVYYIWDSNLIKECDRLPAVPGRASLVHELIVAYKLHKHMTVLLSEPASYSALREFHSDLYLNHLKTFKEVDDDYIITDEDVEYGIGYDCTPVSNMFELISTIAGSSVTAAQALKHGKADIVINWCGGWHHANRFGAEGFCYVNDIVIAIEILRQTYSKVLYIDLDVHHGNGVQDAFDISKTVFTLSFHKMEAGFYPGGGGLDDIGSLSGMGYSANVPLRGAYSDETLDYVFGKVFQSVYEHFRPEAIVIQCGADSLAHDPTGRASLTIDGYCKAVRTVLDKKKPTLLLGGGGYKLTNASKLWASITAAALGLELDDEIPDHELWIQYGPDYCLALDQTLAKDPNCKTYLDNCVAVIRDNLNKYLGWTDAKEEVATENIEEKTITNNDNKYPE